MDFLDRLDPELAAVLATFPPGGTLNWDDLPGTRDFFEQRFAALAAALPIPPGVVEEDRAVPGPVGAPPVPVRIYRPAAAPGPLPGLVWMHGGGLVLGSRAVDDGHLRRIVATVGCVAVSVEYRRAPEHPFPAPLEDCYAALVWAHAHAAALGVDPTRLAVGGGSAGGNLAAALALLARDRGAVPLAFQLLLYPMLDDRNATPSSHAITDPRVWNRASNHFAWRAYLGGPPGAATVPPYAAPARAGDLAGLPPAYIAVGSQDLFLDEDAAYALGLARAGVPVELRVYPGVFHAAEYIVPGAAVAQRLTADRDAARQRALQPTRTRA